MVFRATTILCCFLTTSVPAFTLAQVIEHAHEHLEALLTGHGHTHDDGETPHHDHEGDGTPIPADKSAGMIRAATPTFSKILIQPTEPFFLASITTEFAEIRQLVASFLNFKEHIPPPYVPSIGDTLPLLI
jgi:hypothetical protein